MKNKNLLVLSIFILSFLIISIILPKLSQTSTPILKRELTPTISSDPQVCTDPAAGFSIKYPEGYVFEKSNCHYSPSYYSVETDDGLNKDYIINIDFEKSSEEISTWISKRNFCSTKTSCTKQAPGPITGSVQFGSASARYASIDTILKNNNTILDIKLRARKPEVPISEIAKQKYNDIVSTVVFLAN